MDLEVEMLENILEALTSHDEECPLAPRAILMNPANYALIGWDEVFGFPVLPDERVGNKRAQLICGEEGWGGVHDGRRVWWGPESGVYEWVERADLAEEAS
jgi:hypothetical protein